MINKQTNMKLEKGNTELTFLKQSKRSIVQAYFKVEFIIDIAGLLVVSVLYGKGNSLRVISTDGMRQTLISCVVTTATEMETEAVTTTEVRSMVGCGGL